MSAASPAQSAPVPRHPWTAVSAVGLATFAVVTTEMLPVGLLTPIADDLGASTGTAGLMIALPALLAALFAPLVVFVAGGIDRRRILCALLALLGVPLDALIGDALGWRFAFAAMALFSAAILLLHLAALPALPVAASILTALFVQTLGHRGLQRGLCLTLLLVAGHFAAFTYVRPLLILRSGVDAASIGALLFAYGMAGIACKFMAGPLAARHPRGVLLAVACGLLLTPLLLLWGLAYGGVSVGLMSGMMRAVPHALEVATALYAGVFNIGIALGAWVGRRLLDGIGLHANLWAAAVLAASALLMAATLRE